MRAGRRLCLLWVYDITKETLGAIWASSGRRQSRQLAAAADDRLPSPSERWRHDRSVRVVRAGLRLLISTGAQRNGSYHLIAADKTPRQTTYIGDAVALFATAVGGGILETNVW